MSRATSTPNGSWEVRTRDGGERLVTTIEMLTRVNKRAGSEGRAEYIRKQREMQERRINIVEIDLLRAGTHTTLVPRDAAVRDTGGYDYHVCVYRPDRPEDREVYPIHLPQRLPTITVPLALGNPDVRLSLQSVLDRCYEVGLYARRTNYTEPPEPPLSPEQQTWAEDILRTKGLIP